MDTKYKRLLNHDQKDNDFWPSFTDMLTTILLVVLLFLMAFMIHESKKLSEKQAKIQEQEAKIAQQQQQINYLLGIRKDIIQDLEAEFKKRKLNIQIDPATGAIKFSNDLLFETGKDVIRPEFKQQLQSFIPAYFAILYGKYKDHISEIVVEGHTDDVGSFMNNLELSQRRAFNVVKYILSDEFGTFPHKVDVFYDITANGRSESDLKHAANGTIDRNNSRRVEFKFRLKNFTKMQEITEDISLLETD